jgi:hypothetical protein
MKCPHCGESVSLFSKAMNRFGREKSCPHCQKSVRLFLNLKVAALWFIPTVGMSLVLKSMLGSSSFTGPLSVSITSAALVLLSTRLKV